MFYDREERRRRSKYKTDLTLLLLLPRLPTHRLIVIIIRAVVITVENYRVEMNVMRKRKV